ncbi:hypothetical protein C8C83_0886 [Flavobacterium sp. 90]|uniref:hypothetical protein n=1 Tax=unclassified Flavobacterium TaxID=196869 RepID=UPI000EB18EDD|nr:MULTISPECIES: hypothetical protein [unclassified Flavobacterium]RKR09266.1 hypothetical protein C8C82_1186 [Flavobacterium sp. 81]TCK53049.1 hypothetical protein C8C83_0886 [Flavobacterium sp. 90]
MTKLFPLLFSLLFISYTSQNKPLEIEKENPIGIGILEINSHQSLNIYLSKNLDEVFDTITFDQIYIGNKSGSVEINSDVLKTKLKPYALSASSGTVQSEALVNQGLGGYGTTLKFTVIESNPKYFKVILNESTKEIGYIKAGENTEKQYTFKSWKDYLQSVQMINIDTKTALYDKPGGLKINTVDNHCYLKITDVKNEWAKIEPAKNIVGNENCKNIIGWIKWHNKDTITVKIIVRTID